MTYLITKKPRVTEEAISDSIDHLKLDMTALGSLGAVFYTDGGYRSRVHYDGAPPAVGGFGVFGYIYTREKSTVSHNIPLADATNLGLLNKNKWLNTSYEVYGAEKPEPTQVTPLCYVEMLGADFNHVSNNTAEVAATLNALDLCLQLNLNEVTIKSDSKYTLLGLLACEKRSKSGWRKADGELIANLELWQCIYSIYQQLLDKGTKVYLMWISGHSDSIGNCSADFLATRSMNTIVNGRDPDDLEVFPVKGYWNKTVDRNPLLADKHVYFDRMDLANVTINGLRIYKFGNLGDGMDEYTKILSTKAVSIIGIPTPDPALDVLSKLTHAKCVENELAIFIGRMDVINKPDSYLELVNHDVRFIRRDLVGHQFFLSNKMLVLEEVSPVLLAEHTIVKEYTFYGELLATYINDGALPNDYCVSDITNWVYTTVEKKGKAITKVLDKIDKQLNITVDVKVGNSIKCVPLLLSPGHDLPKHRVLGKIAYPDTQVLLVSWSDSNRSFRHATIVKSKYGTGIWSGIYSNQKFVSKE